MKKELNLLPRQLKLDNNTYNNDEWFDLCTDFIHAVSDLISIKVKDEDRVEHGEDLASAMVELAKYSYLARRERDQALARGYDKYPKGQYNSDEQEAQARQFASEEVRLRALLDELGKALDKKFELNRSAISTAREYIKHG